MAVHHNPVRGRAVYVPDNPLSSVEDDEVDDKDVCGVVYIAAESSGGAWPQKPSQVGNAPLVSHCEQSEPSQPRKRRRREHLAYAALGLAVLLAIIIGAAVGRRKQHHASRTPSADTAAAASAAAAKYAILVTTVPFSVRSAVIPPAGRSDYSCQSMFGTMEAISTYKAATEAAYAAQLTALNASSLLVTNVTCNGVTYQLPPASTAAAAAAHPSSNASPLASRRRLQQQQQQPIPASSALEILTQIEIIQIHEDISVADISISKESPWMIECRGSAVDVAQVVMPKILTQIFRVTVIASSIQVEQLPGIIAATATTASSSSSNGSTSINGSAAAAVNQTVVTRVTTDPFTGYAVDTQVTAVPAASNNSASTSSSSSSSSTGDDTPDRSTNADEPSTNAPITSSTSSHTPAAAAACPHVCDLYNAVSACFNGRCVVRECTPGWEDCDNLADNGCEMDVLSYSSDNAHCGGCGRLCEAPLICYQGVCNMPAAAAAAPVSNNSSSSSADEPAGTDQQQQQQQQQEQPATAAAHPSLAPQHSNSSSNISSSSNITSVPANTPITHHQQQQQQQEVPMPSNASRPSTPKPPKNGTMTNTTTSTSSSSNTTKASKPTVPATKAKPQAPTGAKPLNITMPAQPTAASTLPKLPAQGKTSNSTRPTKPTVPASRPKPPATAPTPAKTLNVTQPIKPQTPATKPKPPAPVKTSNSTRPTQPTIPATRPKSPAPTPAKNPNVTASVHPAAPTANPHPSASGKHLNVTVPAQPAAPTVTPQPPAEAPVPATNPNITVPAEPVSPTTKPEPKAPAPTPNISVPAQPTAPTAPPKPPTLVPAPTPNISTPTEPTTPAAAPKSPVPAPTAPLNVTAPAQPTASTVTPKPPTPALAPPPQIAVPVQPPAMPPATPAVTTVEPQQPSQPPAAAVQPLPAPLRFSESVPLLYDDLVRLTPSDSTLTLDVLANDNLGTLNPSDIILSLLMQPAAGTARVVQGKSEGIPSSAVSRPKIVYTATEPVSPGQSVELYYTIEVKADKNGPPPATVTILGAYTRPNPSLLDCSPTSTSIQGDPLQSLSHADDATTSLHLPFSVKLYGSEYSNVTVSSNGWVSFGSSHASEPCTVKGAWPGAPCLGSGPVLAVFWDDLVPDTVVTHHDESLGAFIIQWTNVMMSGTNTPIGSFQAYVFANGTLGYVYRDLFGADAALGGGTIIGVRGPSSHQDSFARLLKEKPYSDLGAAFDPHASWLWAASADIPDYVTTTSAQIRSLNPGLALISYPQIRSGEINSLGVQGKSTLDQAGSPGSFKPWNLDPKQPLPLLVSPSSPARPTLLQPVSRLGAGGNGLVATIAWKMPPHSPLVKQFRLYVAADALFSEMLRQPAGNAFDRDLSGSTRSVDVAVDSRFKARSVYVLVMACYEDVCSKSCIGLFTLRPQAQT